MKRALAVLLFAAACGKGLQDLGSFPCATDGTCPPSYLCIQGSCAPEEPCDPGRSTSCPGASRGRCALVQARSAIAGQCVEARPFPKADGDACTPPGSPYGPDDPCAPGEACFNTVVVEGAGDAAACRRYCRADTDCVSGFAQCAAGLVGTQYSGLGGLGICLPRCEVFDNTCAGHCDAIPGVAVATGVATCRADGPGKSGDPCQTQNCARGLVCVPGVSGPRCRVPCDSGSHLCATGNCNLASFKLRQTAGVVGFCE